MTPPGHPRLVDSQTPLDPAPAADDSASRSSAPQDPPAQAPSPRGSDLRLDWAPLPRQAQPVPAPSVREQALNDARSNTHRPTAEARMAQRVGDSGLQEEALGNGRRRFRKGGACADVQRTQIAQLNPFDTRLQDLNVAKPCD
jgi:hypothetical protein